MKGVAIACVCVGLAACSKPEAETTAAEAKPVTKASAAPSASANASAPKQCAHLAELGYKPGDWVEYKPGHFTCVSTVNFVGRSTLSYRAEGTPSGVESASVNLALMNDSRRQEAIDAFAKAVGALRDSEGLELPQGQGGVFAHMSRGQLGQWRVGAKWVTFSGERFENDKGQRMTITVTLSGEPPKLTR
jgi:hypothetical protein